MHPISNLAPQPLKLRVMDFPSRHESLYSRRAANDTAALEPGHLGLLLEAPWDYQGDGDSTAPLIFLDPHPLQRRLPPNGYQLVYTPSRGCPDFQQWARQMIENLRRALLGDLKLRADYLNFLEMLKANQSRQLRYELIDCDALAKVPYQQLLGLRFKTLFAMLFSPAHLSVRYWSLLANSLAVMNPGLQDFSLGMQSSARMLPQLLLLGEPEL